VPRSFLGTFHMGGNDWFVLFGVIGAIVFMVMLACDRIGRGF
jgi:hypothetical protein